MIPRSQVPGLAARAFVLAMLLTLAGYLTGCGPSTQQRVLRTTLTAVNTARATFVIWDDQTQARIVAVAPSREAGRAALEAHRARRDRVLIAFEAAYRTLALAAAELQGDRLAAALAAAAALQVVYRSVIGQQPPGTLELPARAGGD